MQNLQKKLNSIFDSKDRKQLDSLRVEDFVIFGNQTDFAESILSGLKTLLKKGKDRVLFVSEDKIWKNCQNFFPKDFLKEFDEILFLKNPKADEKNLNKILKLAKNCDFILGLGSGSINDLCKYSAAKSKISYAIFASAPSMNGYLSKNASITISNHKKTLRAILPKAVFCDLRILKSAPLELIQAGIGDSLCFYSCYFDWYLSHQILGTKFDQRPFDLLEKKMRFLLKNFDKFSIRDDEFLRLLLEILLLSGLGMTIADGSYPASQSEHLISHTIDMKFPKISKDLLHGQMIAVTTLTAAKLQKDLLGKECLDLSEMNVNLDDFFGKKIAVECEKEYQQKLSLIKESAKNISEKNWKNLKKELQKIHFSEEKLKEIFDHFKVKTSSRSLGLSKEQYHLCINHAKFIRNRFTCLDIVK